MTDAQRRLASVSATHGAAGSEGSGCVRLGKQRVRWSRLGARIGEMRTRGATATTSAANTEVNDVAQQNTIAFVSYITHFCVFKPYCQYIPSGMEYPVLSRKLRPSGAAGGERAEDPRGEATGGAGEHDPCPMYGHIPHGFYKDQMQGFFQELGAIKKRVSIVWNRKVFYTALKISGNIESRIAATPSPYNMAKSVCFVEHTAHNLKHFFMALSKNSVVVGWKTSSIRRQHELPKCRLALKPDGVFLAANLGRKTLK
uniref:Uncharacterized protein n=1 Tax=Triticum aestivum TaxID=4565 RepID=A0A077S577_WHEAT|nr:unnamed protein product [Triticum aestivum]